MLQKRKKSHVDAQKNESNKDILMKTVPRKETQKKKTRSRLDTLYLNGHTVKMINFTFEENVPQKKSFFCHAEQEDDEKKMFEKYC